MPKAAVNPLTSLVSNNNPLAEDSTAKVIACAGLSKQMQFKYDYISAIFKCKINYPHVK